MFLADDEVTMWEMLDVVVGLVGSGVLSQDLLAVLSSDTAKSASPRPLVVALHRRAGDPVRARREVEELAADIGECFREAEAWMRAVTSR